MQDNSADWFDNFIPNAAVGTALFISLPKMNLFVRENAYFD
jgi:hypothetical protein